MDHFNSHFIFLNVSSVEFIIISDIIIWAVCFAISISVLGFIARKPNVPHRPVFLFLGILFFFFGLTFMLQVLSNRWPLPNLNLVLRICDAVLGLSAMVVIYIYLPRAMALKTPAEFEAEICERKRSEQKFMGLLESAPDAMVITNKSGKIIMVNKQTEAIFGFRREELLGKEVEILIPDQYHSQHKHHRQGYGEKPRTRPMGSGMDLYGKRKNGSVFPVEVSLSPLQTDKPEDMMIIAAIRDITIQKTNRTELARRTKELETINKELEAFSYTVSHDLRAPLRSINGFSNKIAKDYAEQLPENALDNLNRIQKAGQNMDELINGLLKLSKLSMVEIRQAYTDLSSLALTIVDNLKDSEPNRKAEITIQPDMYVCADKNLMRIVLQNLLDNAWKYSKKQEISRIEFGSRINEGVTEYFVKDNGVGFDMRYANKLFKSFQRLHGSNEFEGTGIGLASVQRIINRHNGLIWVESELNKGTTFFFTIEHRSN